VETLCGQNVCTSEDELKCRVENEGYEEWACEKCEKKKSRESSPWTMHLMYLRNLQKGGYPFKANDLSLEEWIDLGMLNDLIERKSRGF
jgi:hypothetical protein